MQQKHLSLSGRDGVFRKSPRRLRRLRRPETPFAGSLLSLKFRESQWRRGRECVLQKCGPPDIHTCRLSTENQLRSAVWRLFAIFGSIRHVTAPCCSGNSFHFMRRWKLRVSLWSPPVQLKIRKTRCKE